LTIFWIGLDTLLKFDLESKKRPVGAFGDSKTTPPRGLRVTDIFFSLVFLYGYFGLHLAAWNFEFPSPLERILWRISCFVLMGALGFYCIGSAIVVMYPKSVSKFVLGKELETVWEITEVAPIWLRYASTAPIAVLFVGFRGYLLLEGFICLRALPQGVYQSVEWSNFLPHV